jgi:chromosome segregation ATPase
LEAEVSRLQAETEQLNAQVEAAEEIKKSAEIQRISSAQTIGELTDRLNGVESRKSELETELIRLSKHGNVHQEEREKQAEQVKKLQVALGASRGWAQELKRQRREAETAKNDAEGELAMARRESDDLRDRIDRIQKENQDELERRDAREKKYQAQIVELRQKWLSAETVASAVQETMQDMANKMREATAKGTKPVELPPMEEDSESSDEVCVESDIETGPDVDAG